jgi:hypothetical protein
LRTLASISAVLLVGLLGPLLALATARPQAGEIVLVVGPDHAALQAAVEGAGGRLVGPDFARFGVLAYSENAQFAETLLEVGAWFVLDGRPVALFCGMDT